MEFSGTIIDATFAYFGALHYTATQWYFGLSCVLIAGVSYLYHRAWKGGHIITGGVRAPESVRLSPTLVNFIKFCFPREIYAHRSTKTDILYLLSFPAISGIFFKPSLIFGSAGMAYTVVNLALTTVFGEASAIDTGLFLNEFILIGLFAVASALGADSEFLSITICFIR
ncbi:MAG: hypothetical protein ACI915_004068 [Gammaproteobacteria bacterium]|jgi:hypothetical protein